MPGYFRTSPEKSLTASPAGDKIEIVKREKDFKESKMFESIETFNLFILRRKSSKPAALLLVFLAVCLFGLPAEAQYGGGNGTTEDPYLIYTAEQMNAIGTESSDWDKHFRLMADIDLSQYTGTQFNIIGDNNSFKGVFDGNGYAISNFTYTSTDSNVARYIGLFGYVSGENAQIKNLRLIDPVIYAETKDDVGSLIGHIHSGTITACSVENGIVWGNESVGGLVGLTNTLSLITKCYSTATVSGATGVGGLVGESFGKITNCYSSGSVSGNEKIGGLVGRANPDSITNCYSTVRVSGTKSVGGLVGNTNRTKWSFWDIETSGQAESGGGTGKTTAEMQTASTFIGYWGGDPVWTIDEGADYPRLAWQNMPGELIIKPNYAEGSGTEAVPYLIYTAEQLNMIGLFPCDWDKHFKLMADIDLSEYTGTEFNIIGYRVGVISYDNEPFTGVFDGNGRTISNFNYSSTEWELYIGIFGYTERATLENLYLIDPNINVERGQYVGSLVGWSQYGTIAACNVQGGNIWGASEVGGLVGNNHGTITECASLTEVTGDSRIGGLVGYNFYGGIGHCYSLSNVTGTTSVGGLVGTCGSQATIVHCYSAGSVQGTENVGGLLGSNGQGEILYCFWDIEKSGQINSAGGEGKTTAEMQTASTFIGWGPYAVWTINEELDYPRLLWESTPGEMLTTPSFPMLQGSGTYDDPYLIYTAEQLNEIGLFQIEWDKHYTLMADIDLSTYSSTAFNIIGLYNKPFSGVFDGNSHAISNFNYTGSSGGIFCRVEDGEIKNLVLVDPNVNTDERVSYVAALVGQLKNATVSNCSVEGGIVSGWSTVGGLIGRSYYGSTIRDCSVSGFVSGVSVVGGLIGANSGTITNCHFSGEVLATDQVGGLAGQNYSKIDDSTVSAHVSGAKQVGGLVGAQRGGMITGCYAAGSVAGTHEVGGFIGGNNGTIANCGTSSEVAGQTYVGGFAGQNGFNSPPGGSGRLIMYNVYTVVHSGRISNCYAGGSVVGEESVGGLVGYNDSFGTIKNCYAIGSVSGATEAGGLIGQNRNGDVINSYWDFETSGQTISAGGIGKTTIQMQTADTFVRWSACGSEGIWAIDEGNDYPRLWWENQPGEPIFFAGFTGTGSKDDPYLIYTADELNLIGLFPCEWDKSFKLMADINMSGFTEAEFNIIGYADPDLWSYYSDKIPFTGVFDGNGHTISNFTYTTIDTNNVGLFGFVSDPNAEIKNLELVDSHISVPNGEHIGSLVGCLLGGSITNCHATNCIVSGDSTVGGLVGRNGYLYSRGVNPDFTVRITNCHSTGSVTGAANIGGLVGINDFGAIVGCYSTSIVTGTTYVGGLAGHNSDTVSNCYAVGNVLGESTVGGLVGFNFRKIMNCYSAGNVTGSELTGGLVGNQNNWSNNVAGSFWDIETSGQLESADGEGKTTAEMQDSVTFKEAGWDFVGKSDGPSDIWSEAEGNGYPILWWQLPALPSLPTFSGGTGKPDDPYFITTAEDLNQIGHNPRMMEYHFRLINDIDLTGIEFYPIGHKEYPYSGIFDGGDFKISNLTHTSIGTSCVGLFACLQGEDASIIDLGITNANIDCGIGSIVGTLVGFLRKGTIANCYIDSGNISGNDSIGGLVGYNDAGIIVSCSAASSVAGNQEVGGLVGYNYYGSIDSSYSNGVVIGGDKSGGLVGYNYYGSIGSSCSNGAVTGGDESGGLVGYSYNGRIDSSYSTSTVTGEDESGGLVGYNRGNITTSYSVGFVTGNENIGGLVGKRSSSSDIDASFWDIETSGQAASDGGTGTTTAKMQTAATFIEAGWDFVDETENGTEDIWWILEGQDYPRLWWETLD